MDLSTSQSAGQVIVAGFGAGEPPAALCDLARAGALAGFILFRRNLRDPEQIAQQNEQLASLAPADAPVFVAIDQEGGRVARLGPPVLKLPPMAVLGSLDDPELTRHAALILGSQLRALGFNLDFAPVLDVGTNPDNPAIGDRSFGADAARVIRHARAFAAGLADAGIVSCGKHFPGHGDTAVDSHFELPRLAHARERLYAVELAPFAALAASLPCVMTAHVIFDAFDPAGPATLSARVVRELLQRELGFGGLVFSDDLEMKAITKHWGAGEAACAAIAAGCEQLLICSDVTHVLTAHAALCERAERDAEFAERLQRAAQRSLALRRQHPASVATRAVREQVLNDAAARALEAKIARARAEQQ